VEIHTALLWANEPLPWTIWLPLPFFLLEVVLIVIYRRKHS
jgi:hypothetical protein